MTAATRRAAHGGGEENDMTTVEYKFDIDQKVNTPFGLGIITMLGYDEGGAKYYVVTGSNSAWLKEALLEAA
jgi:hypothetical protein